MSENTLAMRGSIWYVIGISLVAALGGFLFGFDLVVVSGTIKSITAVFDLDRPFQWTIVVPWLSIKSITFDLEGVRLGWATSCAVFACIPGAAFAGKLADAFGRKKVLIGTAILFGISAVGAGWSHTLAAFSFYRILGGLAMGAASAWRQSISPRRRPPACGADSSRSTSLRS